MKDEGSKHGSVVSVVVFAPSTTTQPTDPVSVFVSFAEPKEADRARAALQGRWFGRRKVEARIAEDARLEGVLKGTVAGRVL